MTDLQPTFQSRTRMIRWRLAWPAREIQRRWRRWRGTSKIDAATVAHIYNVPPWLLMQNYTPNQIRRTAGLPPIGGDE